jgi:hypothetical protein
LVYKKLLFILILSSVAYAQNPNILWQNTINAVDFDTVYTSVNTSDGGTLLVTTSNSDASGDKSENSNGGNDIWLIKVDKEPTASLQENQLATINIFPNPTTSKVFIDTQSITTIILYDIRGNRILKTTKKEIDLSYLSPGLYIAKIFNSNMKVVSLNKILKQ